MISFDINPNSPHWAPIFKQLAKGKTVRIRNGKKPVATITPFENDPPLEFTLDQERKLDERFEKINRTTSTVEFESTEQTLALLQTRVVTHAHPDDRPVSAKPQRTPAPRKNQRAARGLQSS